MISFKTSDYAKRFITLSSKISTFLSLFMFVTNYATSCWLIFIIGRWNYYQEMSFCFLLNWVFPFCVRLMILLRFRTSRQFVRPILCGNSIASNLPPLFLYDVSIEWRYVYEMRKMFHVPRLYSFALSRIGSGHLVVSVNTAPHAVICINDSL